MKKITVSPRTKELIVRRPNGTLYRANQTVYMDQDVARLIRSGDLVVAKKKTKAKPEEE